MAIVFMSMATRSSDLDEQKPGTNIQKEGHILTPPSGWNGPEDPEAFGSSHPNHHLGLQQGNPATLRFSIALKIR